MPCAPAVPVRRRAGGLATVLVLAASLVPSGAAVAAPSPPTDEFAPDPVQAEAVAGPAALALGDRNGDARPDAFIARWDGGVLVRPGTAAGPGTRPFDRSAEIVVSTPPGRLREIEAADWDGDGADDAVTLLDGEGLTVWTGNPLTGYLAIPDAHAVDTGDVDGDGDLDALVTRIRRDEDLPLQVVSNGTPLPGIPVLERGAEIPACSEPTDARLVDVTDDGKLDAVVVCPALGMVRVSPGLGGGSFGTAISSPAGASPFRLEAGDVVGDRNVDLAVTGSNVVRIMRGFGDGSFGTPTSYAAAGRPRRVLLVDVDGDARLDLASATAETLDQDGVGYRLNRGNGTFGTERRIAWAGAWDAQIADVTGDERPDLVAVANRAGSLAVWEGRAASDPVVELSGLGVGVYEGAAGVALDPDARILGAAAANATTLTVTIASGRATGDVLSANPAAPFAPEWDPATAKLTISSALSQPADAWRAALRTVRFAHIASGLPGGATAGRRIVRAQLGTLPFASRSVDVWLRPPEAGELRLTGVPVTGETLALDAGAWGGTPPVALRPTLERCPAGGGGCVALATDLPYILRSADLGATLRVRGVGTGPDGTSATAYSPRTATIRRLAAPELLSGPGAVTADSTVEVAFRGEEGATFACSVDAGAQAPCVSPLRVSGLADGSHTISVVQVMPSGARSAAAARVFTVRRPVEPPPVTVTTTTPAPPPVTVTTPAPPPTTPVDPPRAAPRPALVVSSRATAAQLRRGLLVRVQHVAKGARATATLQSGKRRVVATTLRATRAGTLQLRLRAASAAVAKLGRRNTLGLAVTVAAPGARQVTLAARIAFRR
ncbi:FG-GAP repeat domain-containing protein [Conexibacter woesei]|uniref:FG-GAP repeat protein n=1 Tax=Conexibacter woesei (strain DSM 14684 / CCUG 47730 / CIP 108061 / JCM 11494 / NBRC 100937 / ID131577) TaxID=469383 RepID=D3F574_CONWI|nr:VCBS repeat-containing protein [Conexibacter woesei]ADB48652.1 FG-GAP repeat protein [Conexibacter woesei DSM 14684]